MCGDTSDSGSFPCLIFLPVWCYRRSCAVVARLEGVEIAWRRWTGRWGVAKGLGLLLCPFSRRVVVGLLETSLGVTARRRPRVRRHHPRLLTWSSAKVASWRWWVHGVALGWCISPCSDRVGMQQFVIVREGDPAKEELRSALLIWTGLDAHRDDRGEDEPNDDSGRPMAPRAVAHCGLAGSLSRFTESLTALCL